MKIGEHRADFASEKVPKQHPHTVFSPLSLARRSLGARGSWRRTHDLFEYSLTRVRRPRTGQRARVSLQKTQGFTDFWTIFRYF